MPQVTMTGPVGPAKTMTAQVFTDVTNVNLDLVKKVAQITIPGRIVEMDIAATTTVTDTITGGNHVMVISQ